MTGSKVILTHELPEEMLTQLRALSDLHILDASAGLETLATAPLLECCRGIICLLNDRVDKALLSRAPMLEFVSSISVGVDHLDLAALSRRKIPVGHTPGVLVDATADTAFALLLAAARRVVEADRFVRRGKWHADTAWSPDFFLGRDLADATLGIIGLGAIGQAVARRAQGFGMRVLGYNRSPREVTGVQRTDFDTVLAAADFVSIHVALTDETRGLINAQSLARMKHGAVLVNTARGGIVDEVALAAALDSGAIFAAGLDVYAQEPLPADNPLFGHERVVLLPHIGSATAATRGRMVGRALENAIAALQGRAMPFCANPEVYR